MIGAVAAAVGLLALLAIAVAAAVVRFEASVRKRVKTVEASLRDATERRYNLLEALPDGLYIVGLDERITLANAEAERLLRARPGGLVGRSLEEVVGPLASDLVPDLRRARTTRRAVERTVTFRSTEVCVELRIQPGANETLVYLRDVSKRTRADIRLRESEHRLRLLMGQVPALLWTADRNGALSSVSGAALALVDSGRAVVGRPVDFIFDTVEATRALQSAFGGETVHFESGHGDRWLRHDVEALRDEEGAIVGAVGVALDITEMRNTQSHLHTIARRDALTGLPNRLGLEESLRETLRDAASSAHSSAVLFVDLDRFKTINDTLGHQVGDALLREVADRFASILGPNDTIARPGGDEFIVIARSIDEPGDVEALAARIRLRLTEPVRIDGRNLYVGASIGGAIYPEHGTTPHDLLKNADVAMYSVKQSGRGSFALFDWTMQATSIERLGMENDLRQALERGELRVLYQPFVDRNLTVTACEALLRWRDPTGREVDTEQVVAIAEESGMICEITRWVLGEACAFAARVRRERPNFRINVNVSGRDLHDPTFALFVQTVLERFELAPSALELEVTEGALLDLRAVRSLEALRALGVSAAVDDFGVSHSVLASLKRLPIAALKIDRSFVHGVGTNEADRAIVTSVVHLGKALGLRVVAEGVEDDVQWRFLAALGVDELQGFLTGRPAVAGSFPIGGTAAESATLGGDRYPSVPSGTLRNRVPV